MNIQMAPAPEKSEAPDVRDVANYLLDQARRDNRPLTPLQLIKLIYYCHGWYLGIHHKPLIRQYVEAWPYGPVIAIIYHRCKKYRDNPITQNLRGHWSQRDFTAIQRQLMNDVFVKYKHFTGLELSTLTHIAGTPWHTIWHGPGRVVWEETNKNPVIPDKIIEDYFVNWLQQSNA